MIARNPGVAMVWIVRKYGIERDTNGGVLFRLPNPVRVEWFAEGRTASREEVMASIESGMPILQAMAIEDGPEAIAALGQHYQRAMALVPQ